MGQPLGAALEEPRGFAAPAYADHGDGFLFDRRHMDVAASQWRRGRGQRLGEFEAEEVVGDCHFEKDNIADICPFEKD
ncbi:MAG: hypothetical protein ABI120_18605, partial [Gemmatimonadaceae bacterium]